GEAAFARGLQQFIAQHDGSAVTCEDFVAAIAGAAGRDLSQFMRWYSQAGTPRVVVRPLYNEQTRSLELTFVQSCPPTPGQPHKEPFLIPLALGLLNPDGAQLRVTDGPAADSAATGAPECTTRLVELSESAQTVRFFNVPPDAIPSLLRGFSAPVVVDY